MNLSRKIRGNKMPLLFPLLWGCIILLYLPAYKAGFYADFEGILENYQQLSFGEFINHAGFAGKSLYQVARVMFYGMIFIFGYHPLPWFLLFTGLHALNGCLVFKFFNAFFKKMDWQKAGHITFLGTVIFLISPMSCEVVVWKACLHYLVAVLIIFLILNWTIAYLEKQHKKYLWLIALFYFISSYMLELFYLTPIFVFLTLCSFYCSKKINITLFKKAICWIFIPLVLLWCAYLLVYHFAYANWVAHYDFNLKQSFLPGHIVSQLLKYIIHILGFESFLSYGHRQTILHFTEVPTVQWMGGILFLISIVAGIWKYRSLNSKMKVIFFLWLSGLSSFILIIPMWFNNVNQVANDRYYYLPCLFFAMLAVALLLSGKKAPKVRYGIIGLYIIACLAGTFHFVMMYYKATRVQDNLKQNFKWQNADTVLLLNLPNNYNGIGMFPADIPDVLESYLKVFGYDTIKGKVYDVSSYNMQTEWDGAHVLVKDSLHLVVTPNQYGCWWWFRSLGAADYENDLYKFTLINNGFSYLLQFKHAPGKGTVMLYQQGGQWRKVDLSKTGEEQW